MPAFASRTSTHVRLHAMQSAAIEQTGLLEVFHRAQKIRCITLRPRELVIADIRSRAIASHGGIEGEMLKRIATSTGHTSRQIDFFVSGDVTDAVDRYIDESAPGHVISTFSAVQSVRDRVPGCELSDDQIERYAVLFAVDLGLAVHFDRRGSHRESVSSLGEGHWHLVWKTSKSM